MALPKDPDTPLLSPTEIVTKPFAVTVVVEEVRASAPLSVFICQCVCRGVVVEEVRDIASVVCCPVVWLCVYACVGVWWWRRCDIASVVCCPVVWLCVYVCVSVCICVLHVHVVDVRLTPTHAPTHPPTTQQQQQQHNNSCPRPPPSRSTWSSPLGPPRRSCSSAPP